MKHLKELGIGAFRPGSDGRTTLYLVLVTVVLEVMLIVFILDRVKAIFPKDYFEDEEVEV